MVIGMGYVRIIISEYNVKSINFLILQLKQWIIISSSSTLLLLKSSDNHIPSIKL